MAIVVTSQDPPYLKDNVNQFQKENKLFRQVWFFERVNRLGYAFLEQMLSQHKKQILFVNIKKLNYTIGNISIF